jgi:hypothetical protein
LPAAGALQFVKDVPSMKTKMRLPLAEIAPPSPAERGRGSAMRRRMRAARPPARCLPRSARRDRAAGGWIELRAMASCGRRGRVQPSSRTWRKRKTGRRCHIVRDEKKEKKENKNTKYFEKLKRFENVQLNNAIEKQTNREGVKR